MKIIFLLTRKGPVGPASTGPGRRHLQLLRLGSAVADIPTHYKTLGSYTTEDQFANAQTPLKTLCILPVNHFFLFRTK